MNILPLVLALALMLSILTVEKLEKFKNQTIIQREYQIFLQENDGKVFNRRQERLFGESQTNLRQLSFRFFLDKEARLNKEKIATQYRILILALMENIYKEATFFKEVKEKHGGPFLEDMLNAVQKAADDAPEKMIKRIQDIARLNLEDANLQKAFYHMLKGTVSREELKEIISSDSSNLQDRAYVSLFNFINYNGKEKKGQYSSPRIMVQRAPAEILKAIFEKDEIVEAIIIRRNEFAKDVDNSNKDDLRKAFENEFKEKRRTGIEDALLDFSISSSDKEIYN